MWDIFCQFTTISLHFGQTHSFSTDLFREAVHYSFVSRTRTAFWRTSFAAMKSYNLTPRQTLRKAHSSTEMLRIEVQNFQEKKFAPIFCQLTFFLQCLSILQHNPNGRRSQFEGERGSRTQPIKFPYFVHAPFSFTMLALARPKRSCFLNFPNRSANCEWKCRDYKLVQK